MKFVSLVLLIVWDRQCQSLPTPGCPGGFARHDPPYDGECCRILHCPPGFLPIPCQKECTPCEDGTFMANSRTSVDGVYRCNVHNDCTGDTEVRVKGNATHDNVCRCKNRLLDVTTGCTCEPGKYLKSESCMACLDGTFKPGYGIFECSKCTNCEATNRETESECDGINDSVCRNNTVDPDGFIEDSIKDILSTQSEPNTGQKEEEKNTTSVPTWVIVLAVIGFIIIIVGIIISWICCRRCKDKLSSNIGKSHEDNTTDCNGASKLQNGNTKPNNGIIKKHKETNGSSHNNELPSMDPVQVVEDSSLSTNLLDPQQDGNDTTEQFSNEGILIDSPTSPSDPPTWPSDPPTSPNDPPTLPSDPPTSPNDPPTLPSEPPTLPNGSNVRDSNPTDFQGSANSNGIISTASNEMMSKTQSEALSSLCAENGLIVDDSVDGKSSDAGASTLPQSSLCGDPNGANTRQSPQVGERDGIQKEIKKPQHQAMNSFPPPSDGLDSVDHRVPSGMAQVQKHWNKLDSNQLRFVDKIHLDVTFWTCLRQYKVLDRDREERIKKTGVTEKDHVGSILDWILRKEGEDFENAFLTLIRALVLSNQKAIADFFDKDLADSIDVEKETCFPSIEEHNGDVSHGNSTPEQTSAIVSSAPSGSDTIDHGVRLRDFDRHHPEQQQRETNIKEIANDIDSEGEDLHLKSTTGEERVGLLKTDSKLKNNSPRPSNNQSPDKSDDILLDEFRS